MCMLSTVSMSSQGEKDRILVLFVIAVMMLEKTVWPMAKL